VAFFGQFEMNNDQLCKIVCKKEKFSPEALKNFKDKIDSEYRVNMWVVYRSRKHFLFENVSVHCLLIYFALCFQVMSKQVLYPIK
jgi:hypothetical protein